MDSKKPAIIVDLDGTIANVEHRISHIRKKPKDWNKFFGLMGEDKPYDWCVRLIQAIFDDYFVIFCTGRPEKYRPEVTNWLEKWQIPYNKNAIFMRNDGDFRPDTVTKKELYENYIKSKYQIDFVLDDRSSVVEMWRSLGLVCLQPKEGDY